MEQPNNIENIDLDELRMQELLEWQACNDEIRHCEGCNWQYHEDNWVEARYGFGYECSECGADYKLSILIKTLD